MALHTLQEDDFPLEVRDEFHKLSAALTTPQKDIAIGTDPKVRTVNLAREVCGIRRRTRPGTRPADHTVIRSRVGGILADPQKTGILKGNCTL
jgi:hypothetical protein